jgi:ADP-heptose:LPS heptosyltransferase
VVTRALVVRLDNAGDVLLAGPAIRAVAAHAAEVVVLAGPAGADAARLLPGVDRVLVWSCPWVLAEPDAVDRADFANLVGAVRALDLDAALVLTSFHQSPLPTALTLRLAGVPWIGAISEDYPGSLLDLRHHGADLVPEPERALSLVRAAGFELPPGDDGRLAVRRPLPAVSDSVPSQPYVVLHPGTSAPARAWPPDRFAESAGLLRAAGWQVVVTGSPRERGLAAQLSAGADDVVNLAGRTSMPELAAVLGSAAAVVVGNTGPAHLAAAVGTAVVSLFAPTVPAEKWAPYGVPRIMLGDQTAPCRDSRARSCPIPGHPCLTTVQAADVVAAVTRLAGEPPVSGHQRVLEEAR